MLNIAPETQFSEADYEAAQELDWIEFSETPRELTAEESEYVTVLTVAADIRKKLGNWPTYSVVLDFIEQSKQKEKEDWNKTHAAEEQAWIAQHKKDVAARNATK
ncbi:MAG TPA: hypothetical protein VHA06_00445 [Candidatus Angelobacter sp.]|jgi:hypothetical protein|nr:hypothetical protein [Candidatus Angelobacter sp.]